MLTQAYRHGSLYLMVLLTLWELQYKMDGCFLASLPAPAWLPGWLWMAGLEDNIETLPLSMAFFSVLFSRFSQSLSHHSFFVILYLVWHGTFIINTISITITNKCYFDVFRFKLSCHLMDTGNCATRKNNNNIVSLLVYSSHSVSQSVSCFWLGILFYCLTSKAFFCLPIHHVLFVFFSG